MAGNKEIQPGEIWHKDKKQGLKHFILEHARKQSPERLLRNKLLAIRYKIEDEGITPSTDKNNSQSNRN